MMTRESEGVVIDGVGGGGEEKGRMVLVPAIALFPCTAIRLGLEAHARNASHESLHYSYVS